MEPGGPASGPGAFTCRTQPVDVLRAARRGRSARFFWVIFACTCDEIECRARQLNVEKAAPRPAPRVSRLLGFLTSVHVSSRRSDPTPSPLRSLASGVRSLHSRRPALPSSRAPLSPPPRWFVRARGPCARHYASLSLPLIDPLDRLFAPAGSSHLTCRQISPHALPAPTTSPRPHDPTHGSASAHAAAAACYMPHDIAALRLPSPVALPVDPIPASSPPMPAAPHERGSPIRWGGGRGVHP